MEPTWQSEQIQRAAKDICAAMGGGGHHADVATAMIESILRRYFTADKSESQLQKCWEELTCHTDGHNWYWLSYGEKCYAYATVTAFPVQDDVTSPPAGGFLQPSINDDRTWIAEDGTRMIVDDNIASVEQQNGNAVCKFIAAAFADAQRRFDR